MAIKNSDDLIAKIVLDDEFKTAINASYDVADDFEASIDMLECQRTEKKAKWMSDIFLPEYPSHVLTESANFVRQYFTVRDFVECYLEDGSADAVKKAAAAKECINRTLNMKHLYYFQKFVRARLSNNMAGVVYARCWWEKRLAMTPAIEIIQEDMGVDEEGNQIIEETQRPGEIAEVTFDRFDFDILDPRNVFTDNTYSYSLQQKNYVIIRFERSLTDLKADADLMGYINLDKLKDIKPPKETKTSEETYNKDDRKTYGGDINKNYDIIERHGKWWAIVTERFEDGRPKAIKNGLDNFGEPKKSAELVETVITFATSGTQRQMIRFQPAPYKDSEGNPYRPIIRGICYIHPSKDSGLGDGKYARELQAALNDTFNLSNDRVMLATLPTMKGKKYQAEDNKEIYFAPGHTIPLEHPDDLVEMKISDNINGALQQMNMLTAKMQQTNAIFPTTMGATPAEASTTATAIAGAESRTDTRTNYKSLTFEHTFLNELYWMILQMTYQFAEQETAKKLMGEKAYDFDPSCDYTYKPVSQAIELEYSKSSKIKQLTQILGYVGQVPNPKTPALLNKILTKIFEYMGDETEQFRDDLLDESQPVQEGQHGMSMQPGASEPTSNQMGANMRQPEEMARGMV